MKRLSESFIEAMNHPKTVIIHFPIAANRLRFFSVALDDRRPIWCREGAGFVLSIESDPDTVALVALLCPTIEELGPASPVLVGKRDGMWPPDLHYIPVRRRFFEGPRYDAI